MCIHMCACVQATWGYLVIAIDEQDNWGSCFPAGTVEEILQASSHPIAQQRLSTVVNDAFEDQSGEAVDIADSFGVATWKTTGVSFGERLRQWYEDRKTAAADRDSDRTREQQWADEDARARCVRGCVCVCACVRVCSVFAVCDVCVCEWSQELG